MRTYGTLADGTWVEVDTDASGNNSYVWLTTLIQTLLLVTGENPLYASYGIPAVDSVISQTAPDAAVVQIQTQFAQYFQSLVVLPIRTTVTPTYQINAVFLDGTAYQSTIAT